MKDIIKRGRKVSKQVAVAMATYETLKKTSKTVAEVVAHTWKIDEDYAAYLNRAGKELAFEYLFALPGQRQHMAERAPWRNEVETFSSDEWMWLRLPGIGPVQARTGEECVEFRAFRLADITALRELVAKRAEEIEAEDSDVDFEPLDIRQTTDVYSWDSDEQIWSYRKGRPSRPFKSVMLPADLQTAVEEDLQSFTASRERLQKLELPWRRGYLLEGPPGTGKTSLSLTIAGALGFKLMSLSLTDVKSDGELRKAISGIPPKTVLVIEDIDAYAVSHERDHNSAKDGDLSLSGVLNAIDGFETPDGLVTIATTNHAEKLDEALVRPGRFDRKFAVDFIQARELERLFGWFYEGEPPMSAPDSVSEAKLSPAQATELFKQHLNDPEGGWGAVMERVGGRRLEVAA